MVARDGDHEGEIELEMVGLIDEGEQVRIVEGGRV